jgi:hypothetical protein
MNFAKQKDPRPSSPAPDSVAPGPKGRKDTTINLGHPMGARQSQLSGYDINSASLNL